MQLRKSLLFFIPLAFCSMSLFATELPIGLVSFPKCITESKYGKREQEEFEHAKSQMMTFMTDRGKQLEELARQLSDSEFLDSLSPEAEKEMRDKFQTMQEEYARYEQEYMQVLNQSNAKLIQVMHDRIAASAGEVAKARKLSIIVREDCCFYCDPSCDITDLVVKEMDAAYDGKGKEQGEARSK